jgi:cyanophycinase
MPGSAMLIGGNEFGGGSTSLLSRLLRAAGQDAPRVTVLPTAADNPRKAARQAVGALNALGAKAAPVMIADATIASDPAASAALESTQIVYLTDGNPLALVEALKGTEALARLQRAWANGVVLAASGAGAMALCDYYWDSGLWEKALGVLKGMVVLPHHEMIAGRFNVARLRTGLPAGYVLLGIDEQTAALITGQEGEVLGAGHVTVYRANSEQEYPGGQTFQLDAASG